MPLFFFISGYLYKEEYNSNILLLLKRRFKTLYLPFICFGLFFLLYHDVFEDLVVSPGVYKHFNLLDSGKRVLGYLSFGFTVNKIMDPLLSPFWFVMTLFTVEVLYSRINFSLCTLKLKNPGRLLPVIVLTLGIIAGYLKEATAGMPDTGYVQMHLIIALFFFCGGNLYRKYGRLVKISRLTCLVSFVILLVSSFFLRFDLYLLKFAWLNRELNSCSLLIYYPVSFLGIYFILSFCKIFESNFYSGILTYVGRNTLQILALHLFFFHLVNLILGHPFYFSLKPGVVKGSLWSYAWILYTAAGVFSPLLLKLAYVRYLSGKVSTTSIRTVK
jgi:fucose 4-O-acetylase-like acetyltransferase